MASFSNFYIRVFPMLLLILAPLSCQAGTYSQKKSLHDTLLASSNYNPEERPMLNQSEILYVNVIFELVSITEINDVVQSFKCNGFLGLFWTDEILRWNSSDYGGETVIAPKMTSVFRPRMIMLNTMGNRDLFEDDTAPFNVYTDGSVKWVPGGIFPASCKLDLTKYPFDKQHCRIEMITMNFDLNELQFQPRGSNTGDRFFTQNGQWDIVNNSISAPVQETGSGDKSTILISFDLKRKPTFVIISMVLPILFLSLLNLFVFLIPVESGEKISYGITVLLALSVFLSIMSSMLPSSSESMPLLIDYIFIVLTISVLTVLDTIFIVRLNHMEEKEEKSQKAKANFKSSLAKIKFFKKEVSPLQTLPSVTEDLMNQNEIGLKSLNTEDAMENAKTRLSIGQILSDDGDQPRINKYKLIGKYIDMVSLAVFGVIWVSVTIGYMAAISAQK